MSSAAQRSLCISILILGFASYLFSLDRYPFTYADESFFNWPAISYLHGGGFIENVAASAPFTDQVWAYHGPFYPHLEILTFKILGVSRLSARLPQFVAAWLAIGLLCALLMRRGMNLAAVILSVLWIGDRTTQEILCGRPDGVATLCEAIGFICLVRFLELPRQSMSFLCGMALATAAGFHPVSAVFSVAALAALALRNRSPHTCAWFIAGAAIPAVLVLCCWLPHPTASVQQFLWHMGHAYTRRSIWGSFANLIATLRLSKYEFIAMVVVLWGFLVPLVMRQMRAPGTGETSPSRDLHLLTAAALFSVSGFVCLFSRLVVPYYLVHFTPWVLLAAAIFFGSPVLRARAGKPVLPIALLLCGWLPSLVWNSLRLRESLLFHRASAPNVFIAQIKNVIPSGAIVMGSPDMTLPAEEAGLNFTPVTWFPESFHAPSNVWLLCGDTALKTMNYIAPDDIKDRSLIFSSDMAPGLPKFGYPYDVFGPASAAPSAAPNP